MTARILIIEDNATNCELMAYLLRAAGHIVTAATSGTSGLAAAARDLPDVILCDIHLPDLDGYEVARRIRAEAALRDTPMIAVTALAMVGDRETILAAGFDDYIAKPIVPETFVAQIQAQLDPDREMPLRSIDMAERGRRAPLSGATTVLVVDDHDINLELARSVLESFAYRTVTAHRIDEALQLARETQPDLILSDVCMAGGSGYDFIRAIKAEPRLRDVPFVFITSTMTSEGARQAGLRLGASDYLFRPIEPRALLAALEACLRKEG